MIVFMLYIQIPQNHFPKVAPNHLSLSIQQNELLIENHQIGLLKNIYKIQILLLTHPLRIINIILHVLTI